MEKNDDDNTDDDDDFDHFLEINELKMILT